MISDNGTRTTTNSLDNDAAANEQPQKQRDAAQRRQRRRDIFSRYWINKDNISKRGKENNERRTTMLKKMKERYSSSTSNCEGSSPLSSFSSTATSSTATFSTTDTAMTSSYSSSLSSERRPSVTFGRSLDVILYDEEESLLPPFTKKTINTTSNARSNNNATSLYPSKLNSKKKVNGSTNSRMRNEVNDDEVEIPTWAKHHLFC